MAITASELPFILQMKDDIFQNGRTFLDQYLTPVTLEQVLRRQTARVQALANGEKSCQVRKVWWSKTGNSIGSASNTMPTLNCTIGTGNTISTDSDSYEKNLSTTKIFTISNQFCNNALDFKTEWATELGRNLHMMAVELNNEILSRLDTAAQVPTYVGQGTLNVNVIEYPIADQTPDTLSDWRLVGIKNFIPNGWLLHGTNYYNVYTNAQYQKADDDKRSKALMLGGVAHAWDIQNADGVLGDNISLMIDPNMTVFYAEQSFGNTPENKLDDNNTIVQSIPLTYIGSDGTMQTLMYNNAGVMTPVYVDMYIQNTCVGTQDGTQYWGANTRLVFRGFFGTAPTDDTKAGILKFEFV